MRNFNKTLKALSVIPAEPDVLVYKSALVAEYCDSVKEENDAMREMGIE